MNLSKHEKEFFSENGYFIIDNAFTKQDLGIFKKNLTGCINFTLKRQLEKLSEHKQIKQNKNFDEGFLALKNLNQESASVVQRIIARSPEFLTLCSKPKVTQSIKNLLITPQNLPLYLTTNGVIFTGPRNLETKGPLNFELGWHLDIFYTIPRSHFVQWWAPLMHDATEEIGTLIVCPGSHKRTVKQEFNSEKPYDEMYTVHPDELANYQPKAITLKLGQLLIFDGHLIHRSGINKSHQVRCSMIGMCHNVAKEEFLPLSTQYKYFGPTPEAYFYELYGDENVKSLIYEQAVNPVQLKTGV